jgi:hypothetical protein
MTKIRVLFNIISNHDLNLIIPMVKNLGINSISIFGTLLYKKLPSYFKIIGKEFDEVVVNLYHTPTYENRANWKDRLISDGERVIGQLADLEINRYAWMIELNLYGQLFNPLVRKYINRNKLIHHFNTFYDVAHDVNPNAQVIVVPYPHNLMNLSSGIKGWRSWWVKHGEKLNFDLVSLNAHIGTWIPALTNRMVFRHLIKSIKFIQERGHELYYVEVGYPTVGAGHKPLIGGYGWGREKDQVNMLKTCYQALKSLDVPYMQICEFIDPVPKKSQYEVFFSNKGDTPKIMNIPVLEELHWGLLKNDGSEKLAADLIKKITQK